VKDEAAGRSLACQGCGQLIRVPRPSTPIPADAMPIDLGDPSVDARIASLTEHVKTLRRNAWWWRLAGSAALAASLSTSGIALLADIGERSRTSINRPLVRAEAITTKVISAESFVIRDEEGRPRGGFGCMPGQAPSFTLMDGNGTKRAVLFLQRNGDPFLVLCGPNGKGKIMLAAQHGDQSGLVGNDDAGTRRLILGLDNVGKPLMNVYEQDGSLSPLLDNDGRPIFRKP
jgi:hypothetical protein